MYLVGMICAIASCFMPFISYKFTMGNVEPIKGTYSLMQLKKLQQSYSGMGRIGICARIMPFVIIVAGIAGIVIVMIYLSGDRNTWDIFNLNMAWPSLIIIISTLLVNTDKTIKAIRAILDGTTEDMLNMGYKGTAGYGIGFYILILGCILSVAGAVCFFALDKE
jgi:hypothetical protein